MNKLTEWLVKPFIKEEFGAPAGTLPSPSQEKRKKVKKKLDKYGQKSVYSDSKIGESLPIKVTDKIKKVKNKPETDAEKDFSQHHKYSLSAPMGSLSEPDTYDWDDDYKEKGGHQKEKDKKKKGYEPVKEATEKITKVVGIYGGRFQPFGPHHLKTYQWLSKQVDDAYITTSNIKQPPRHPMNFSEKVRHMVKMGVPKNRIIQEKSPYIAKNVLKKYDKDTTAVIYIFGKKDAGRLSGGKYFQDYKKNKSKMNGYKDNGYVLTAPHVSIKVGGKEVSGTVMRDLLGSPQYKKNREKLFRQAFGYFDKGIFTMMNNKFKKLYEFIDNNIDKVRDIIKESSVMAGSPVDDGPPTFHISFNDYKSTSKAWIEKTFEDLGFQVINYMISKDAKDPLLDFSIRLNTVPAISYGNLNTSKEVAIGKYKKNMEDRVLNNVGFEIVKWFGLKDDFSETTGVDVAQPVLPGKHNAEKNTDLKEAFNLDDEVKFLLEVDGMLLEEGVKFNNFLKDWSKKGKQPLDKVRKTMMNKNTFSIAKLNDFSVDKVLDNAKKGFKAYQKVINYVPDKISKKLAKTKFGQKKEKGLKKLDNFLQKNPKLKRVMGVAAAAGVTYAWTKMTFIGDPEYDLDLSAAASAAASGDYTMSDLFSGEMGTKFLVLTAVGATTGLTAPYTKILGSAATMAAGVSFGAYRAIKKSRQKKADAKKKASGPDTVKNPNPRGRKKTISKQSAVRWVSKNKGNKAAQKYAKSLTEAPRVPRKKGQHRGSKSHSDLYTDENPKGTIKGLKFATVADAKASVSKINGSGKTHAHKIQAAVAMEQRAREMGKTSQAAVYRAFINKMKKKTKKKNESNKYTFGPDWIPTSLAQRKKMKRIHQKTNRSIRKNESKLFSPDWWTQKLDLEEAFAVKGNKVEKFITGKNLTHKGRKYKEIEFETIKVDNPKKMVTLRILAPKNLFGQKVPVRFQTLRRGPFLKTDTKKKVKEQIDKSSETKELLLMGGAAGHMSHPFDDNRLTFGDFKNIINMSLEGKLSREDNVTEKLDGQNLMISYVDGELKGARNKGHLKNRGKTSLNIAGMKSVFSGRGDIEKAFVGAMKDLQNAVGKLSDAQKEKAFGNGSKWMNLEIVYPATANIIDYDVSELFFHGSVEVNEDGTVKSQVTDSARMLEGMIRQANANIQKRFKVSKPVVLNLPKVQDFSKKKKYFLSKLRKLQAIYKLKDNNTLGMHNEMYWREYIFNGAKQHKYKIPKNVLESLVKRWAYLNKSFRLDKKSIKNEKFLSWAKGVDKFDHKKLSYDNIKPFELLFLELGAEILKNLEGFLAVNPKKAVQKIKKDLKSAISGLKTSKDIKKIDLLKKNLNKINSIGGTSAIVPSEGLVFKYKGNMYKFTGAFAPVNQIVGALKF